MVAAAAVVSDVAHLALALDRSTGAFSLVYLVGRSSEWCRVVGWLLILALTLVVS